MSNSRLKTQSSKIPTAAAIATVLLGWLLLLPVGSSNPLVRYSYDLLQLFLPEHGYNDLVVILMDDQAMRDYGQQSAQRWPRALHTRLLDRLSQDEPRVVVFDVTLTEPSDPAADDELARAIGRNGRVVLAGNREPVPGVGRSYTIAPPIEQFETNAAGWGIARVIRDPDQGVRRYDNGDDQYPGLAWAAATVAGAPVTRDPKRRLAEERWLNYYGAARPFESLLMTYSNAETRAPGFFRGKAVFIGGKPSTLLRGEITDVFTTPFTKWNSSFIPGVELTAIAYSNLMHEDWLRSFAFPAELGLLLVTGVICGFGLHKLRLRTALWTALGIAALILAGAVSGVVLLRFWFPWMVIGLAQLPCGLLFRLLAERTARTGLLEIPDHTLIRCIGEGAYGQVWVARNEIGIYHAVKVLYRNRFGTDEPYERALRGIQKFMPVSRSHEGFVHILHLGRNEATGFFFYIMEAGDDQLRGQQIDPDTYTPKTFASELKARDMIPPRECLQFMLAVTEAVERLHQHHLIHRDIKPANIIFVNGRPKLADIDLVTDLSDQGDVSRIGTEGYMAPEGPGTAAADVFSLGRILYVALSGKSPDHSPDLPTRFASREDCDLFLQLNDISCKACEIDPQRRYASAALMRADLLKIHA